MTVREFTKLDKPGIMYRIIDASKNGYLVNPDVLIEADRNVTKLQYGDCEIIRSDIVSKKGARGVCQVRKEYKYYVHVENRRKQAQ